MIVITNNGSHGTEPALNVAALPVLRSEMNVRHINDQKIEMRYYNAPKDAQETIVFDITEVPNVYANLPDKIVVPRAEQVANRRGEKIYIRFDEIFTRYDDADETKPKYKWPLQASLSFKIPDCEYVTDAMVEEFFERFLGAIKMNGTNHWRWWRSGIVDPADHSVT
jgi:hypothetical protein